MIRFICHPSDHLNLPPLLLPMSVRPGRSEAPDLRLLGDEAYGGGAEKVGSRKGAEDTTDRDVEVKPPCAALLLEVKVFVKHGSHQVLHELLASALRLLPSW